MANWGVHYCDAMRWVLAEQAPISISAHGGRFAVDDDRTIPDTMEVIFELASGALLISCCDSATARRGGSWRPLLARHDDLTG